VLSDREAIEILRGVALTGGEREASRAVRLMVEVWRAGKTREAVPAGGDDDLAGVYAVPNPGRVRPVSDGLTVLVWCSRCGGGHMARDCPRAAE